MTSEASCPKCGTICGSDRNTTTDACKIAQRDNTIAELTRERDEARVECQSIARHCVGGEWPFPEGEAPLFNRVRTQMGKYEEQLTTLRAGNAKLQEEHDRLAASVAELREAMLRLGKPKQFVEPCFCLTLMGTFCVGQPQCKKANTALAATADEQHSTLADRVSEGVEGDDSQPTTR